jgi:conjugal transfer pilin signal peptidase TrbI
MDARAKFALHATGLMSSLFLAGLLLINALGSFYRIGVDLQQRQCLPWKWYFITVGRPPEIHRGDILVAIMKYGRMGHGFDGQKITKMVFALPGDAFEVKNDLAYINGKPVGRKMDLIDKLGKQPGSFDRKEIVPAGHVLLLGTEPRSFDGRYWGFVPENEIVAKATPLW